MHITKETKNLRRNPLTAISFTLLLCSLLQVRSGLRTQNTTAKQWKKSEINKLILKT